MLRFIAFPFLLLAAALADPANALDSLRFQVVGGDGLEADLRAVSRVQALADADTDDAQELFGAAMADYRVLLEAMYARARYSAAVSIRVDGREAAEVPLLNVPREIRTISIRVDAGPEFRIGQLSFGPVPPGFEQPEALRPGQPAASGAIADATGAAVQAWRDIGYPKAGVAEQRIVADHARRTISGTIRIAPGPRATIGQLIIRSDSAVREAKIRRIASLPTGQRYSPDILRLVTERLRRTGAFSSVVLEEAATVNPDNSIDIVLSTVDRKPRRFGFGAEIASLDGLGVSAFWLHRNALGGAEQFRVDASVSNIGSDTSGIDYSLGARLDAHAAATRDSILFFYGGLEWLDEPVFTSETLTFGVGLHRILDETLNWEAALELTAAESTDATGTRTYRIVSFPVKGSADRRDDPLNPTGGFFAQATLRPFHDFSGSVGGLRATLDARAYRSVGRVVLAGRAQIGSVLGPDIDQVHPDYLFYSGGGGTVRGQPYQSLNVQQSPTVTTGGRSFVGLSGEVRVPLRGAFSAVAFADAGYVGAESVVDGSGEWHSGAGVGVRYGTPLGPLRFDVGFPTSGTTGDGVQLYLGIGQAF